ncbi:MAG TPA: DUF4331 family protein [Gemmatimonadaceae bacterium]|nr:DUF4331 family protein [Gemmatimonadaceae bacterium]
MSHHYSGPKFGFPRGDARLDFTDLFAFPKPGEPSKSVLIMDVHPSVGVNPPGPTTAEPFAPDALYEIRIDTDGDAVADLVYQVRFTPSDGGAQTATVRRLEDAQAAAGTGPGGQVIVEGAPVSMGRKTQVTEAGDYRFFAGWRSDPFFFDGGGLNNFQFTGTDFFADKDICSIALVVPNADLGTKEIRLWARTLARLDDGSWVQADRGARPSQTVFLTGDENEAYRAARPADDARFIAVFGHSLEHTGGFSPEEAKRAAATLLPDLLRYDPTRPASYPDNGRKPSDDVADAFLTVITNGKITGDGIGPHGDLLPEFPYLGLPHTDRSSVEAGVEAVRQTGEARPS